MSYNKSIDSSAINSNLTAIANAIRAKTGGSGQLAFPNGFISEINNISGGLSSFAICLLASRNGTRPNLYYRYQVPSGFDPNKILEIYGYDNASGFTWFHMKPTSGYIVPYTAYNGYRIAISSSLIDIQTSNGVEATGANCRAIFVMEKS